MSTIQVRRATAFDAEVLSRLNLPVGTAHAAAWPTSFKSPSSEWFSPGQIRELLADEDRLFWVAEREGGPAGFAYAQVLRRPESGLQRSEVRLQVNGLAVAPEHQRRGCGTALLKAVREAAHELKISTLTLDVWSFNTEAKAFYEAAGFAVYKEAMRLDLPPSQ